MATVKHSTDVIKKHYDSLHTLLADAGVVSKLILLLYKNELITFNEQCQLDDCAGRGAAHQATELLTIIINLVSRDPLYFGKFVRTLMEDPVLHPTAVQLSRSYSRWLSILSCAYYVNK